MTRSNRWNFRPPFSQTLELLLLFLLAAGAVRAADPAAPAEPLSDPTGRWRADVDERGGLRWLEFARSNGWERTTFRSDRFAGPRWQVEEGGRWIDVDLAAADAQNRVFEGRRGSLKFGLRYEAMVSRLALMATLHNEGTNAVGPLRAGLRLGLDTYMARHPEWRTTYFPTLLRCEPTHFWSYFMSPQGRILGIASPDPVASWHLDYEPLAHRIYTASLDLLNPPPLPARHPRALHTLATNEMKVWTLFIEDIPSLEDVKPRLAAACRGPLLAADPHTVEPGGGTQLKVFSLEPPSGQVRTPGGFEERLAFREGARGHWSARVPLGDQPGLYPVQVIDARGREAQAMLGVRRPWSWYLQQARREAVAKPQKASSHTESWYGLFPAFHARRLFPDPELDAKIEAKFQEIWPLMYDLEKKIPSQWEDRIQNHACAAGLMAARYRATRDIRDLEFAASLCDFLLTKQTPDGAYRNKGTHYTSVVYIGKSILEVMAEERRLARTHAEWKARFDRHYASVRRAMDDLALHRDNIQTEGQQTFEDGMIACSYTQLALFALWQTNDIARRPYTDAALDLAAAHRCLSQLQAPDSRMHGGSLRFWESQYDVLATPNMMTSPHGWSAWRIYGLWYLYRLTGDETLLRQAYDALGSAVQLIDAKRGELRWAFVADPYVNARLFAQDPGQPGRGRWMERVVGEEYLPMISGWFRAKPNTWVTGYWATKDQGVQDGGCCDNDVHEIFKCLEEVALTVCHVVERPGGSFVAYHGTAGVQDNVLIVEPADSCVASVHVNLLRPRTVRTSLAGQTLERRIDRLGWLGRVPSL